MESIKNFFKGIFIFGIGCAIMFEILILVAVISLKNEEEEEKNTQQIRFNIYSVTMQEIPINDESKAIFPNYDDSEFEGKIIYELQMNVDNAGDKDINQYYDLSYFTINDSEEYYIPSNFVNYYQNDAGNDYGHLSIIPAGKSGIVTYYLLVDEYKNMDELHIHTGYDEDEYIEVVF